MFLTYSLYGVSLFSFYFHTVWILHFDCLMETLTCDIIFSVFYEVGAATAADSKAHKKASGLQGDKNNISSHPHTTP